MTDHTTALKEAGARVEAMLGRELTRGERLIASLMHRYGWQDGRHSMADELVAGARAKNAPHLATVTELRK